jgi:hypothetical protein
MRPEDEKRHSSGLSWATMLIFLFSAIALAVGIACWILYPFFQRARQ